MTDNLPDGVTQQQIDEHFGEEYDFDREDVFYRLADILYDQLVDTGTEEDHK